MDKSREFNVLSQISNVFLCCMFSIFILVCAPYNGITLIKFKLFCAICTGFILSVILYGGYFCIKDKSFAQEIFKLIKQRKIILALGFLYLLFTVISALTSPFDYNVFLGYSRYEGIITQGIYVLIMIFCSMFAKLKKHHLYILSGTTVIFCIICLLQTADYNPFFLFPDGLKYSDAYIKYPGEYLGTIGNADLVSAFLAVTSMVFLIAFVTCKGKDKAVFAIAFLLNAATLFCARVAAGIVGFCVTSAVAIPYLLYRKNKKIGKLILIFEAVAAVFFLLCLYFYDFGSSGTLYELHNVLCGNISDSFGSGRIKIWSQVLEHMKSSLLFGTGPDSMMLWGLEGFTRFIPHVNSNVTIGIDVAHNEFLNIAAQQGVLALLSYTALLIYAFAVFCKGKHDSCSLIAAFGAGAYLVQSFFSFSMCITAPFLWILLGVFINRNE